MKRLLYIIQIVLLTIIICSNINYANAVTLERKKIWTVLKTDKSKIIFIDKTSLETRLYGVKYYITMKDSNDMPYFVISGKTCEECDENVSIFIFNPNDTLSMVEKLSRYRFPGKQYDYEDRSNINECRLFILKDKSNRISLFWIEKHRLNKKITRTLLIVDLFGNKLRERFFSLNLNEYEKRLMYLCSYGNEIKGIETTSEP